MSAIGSGGISIAGIYDPEDSFPFYISGTASKSDVSSPVALDTTANNTAKLAGDGDEIIGVLASFENRVTEGVIVGSVVTEGGFAFPIKAGDTLARGDSVVGGGSGTVKKRGSATAANIVVAISAGVAEVWFRG